MTMTDDLEQARAALQMINPAPYNAEAPPEALIGDITPTELHYVRSNFAVPAHDGTLEIGGAVERPDHPDARRPPRHAGDRAGRHPRMRRQRPTRDATAPDRRTVGRLRRLDRPLDRRPPHDVLEQARPAADGVDVRFEGADHGPYHLHPILADTDKDDLTFVRSLPLAHRRRPGGGDPDRLRDERRTAATRSRRPVPDHRAPLVRRRLRQVAAPHRRAHRAVRRRVPDRPLHLRVARPPPRAGHPDARAGPHHRPRTRRRAHRSAHTRCAARPGPGPDPITTRRGQPHRRRRVASGASSSHPRARTNGRTGRSTGTPTDVGRHTLRARATDAAGNVQPEVPPWNRLGYGNNAIEVSTSTCAERVYLVSR